MMAACPNCRSQVNDEQMFCRTCGFRLEPGFQISTHSLGLPSAGRLRISQAAASHSGTACGANWRNYLLPIAGFILALCFGGFTAAFFSDEPLPQLIVNSAPQLSERSYMGVYLINDNMFGPVVDRMLENSPAEQAGLHSGDRILAINGQEISTTYDVVSKLTSITPNSVINVKVQRNNVEHEFTLNTARRTELNMQSLCTHEGFLGVGDLDSTTGYMNSESPEFSKYSGVRIGMVVDNSAADLAGLQADDLIVDVDGIDTHTPDELSRIVRATTPGQNVNVRILRNGELINVMANIGSRN